ncbi:OLC1v1020738C1 [Oldenlandia corymbosa var. corymbosa]|uniref:OLC1v1020738C1 n=1 Tax=Oldenlandia corymbosa var. corymbosa TaxID=529605 RepID=A0AAV1BXR4_OLDCO|nr:OLC1v1020738C1 [Oldenlandia corymbosa var. corymbosa]
MAQTMSVFFILLSAMVIQASSRPVDIVSTNLNKGTNDKITYDKEGSSFSSTWMIKTRVLGQNTGGVYENYMCEVYPKVCHLKGSVGKDCCNNKCVDVKSDNMNCSKCGDKCEEGNICCNGKCIDINTDKHHCGGCNNKCTHGVRCNYGMCGYAA